MTSAKFISELAQIYAVKPNETQARYLAMWLSKRDERFLDFLFSELVKTFSPSHAIPFPLVSTLEAACGAALESLRYQETISVPKRDQIEDMRGYVTQEEFEFFMAEIKDLLKRRKGKVK